MKSPSALCVAAAVGAAAAAIAAKIWYSRRLDILAGDLADAVDRRNRLALELMSSRNRRMHTAESVERGRTFKPRRSDVFVVTYPKCGTTWMTQIVHALRANANMSFGDINEVCPWDILAHDCKQDLDADQGYTEPESGQFVVCEPRCFKSHEAWDDVAKGGRYIYVARDPADAFFSFFKFLPSFAGLRQGDLDAETFAASIFAGVSHSGQIWDHFLGWWRQRHNPDVLWIFFEDLANDLRGEVARVADFLGIPADNRLLDRVVKVSSFESMASSANRHHYDDHMLKAHIYPVMGIDPLTTQEVIKVRAGGGKVGSRRQLPPALAARLEAKWEAVMRTATGCDSYASFRANSFSGATKR